MKRVGTFITGLLVGATLFGGTVAYALSNIGNFSLINRAKSSLIVFQTLELANHPSEARDCRWVLNDASHILINENRPGFFILGRSLHNTISRHNAAGAADRQDTASVI